MPDCSRSNYYGDSEESSNNYHWSDSQLGNSINEKTEVSNEIINLVKDNRVLPLFFHHIRIEHCNGLHDGKKCPL